jgi:hypothetical protein
MGKACVFLLNRYLLYHLCHLSHLKIQNSLQNHLLQMRKRKKKCSFEKNYLNL